MQKWAWVGTVLWGCLAAPTGVQAGAQHPYATAIDERLPAGIDAVNASCLFYERVFRVTLHRIEDQRSVRDLFPAARQLGHTLSEHFPELRNATDDRAAELGGRYAATVEYLRALPIQQQQRWLEQLHDPDVKPWVALMQACPAAMQWSRWVAKPDRLIDPTWREAAVLTKPLP